MQRELASSRFGTSGQLFCLEAAGICQTRPLILCHFPVLYQDAPEAATLTVRSDERGVFKLSWTEPEENGFPITSYKIYTKLVSGNENSGEWKLVKTVNKDVLSDRLTLKAEGRYQIVVTATNRIGEAKKEDGKIETVEVPAGEWQGDVCQSTFTVS